MKFPEVTKAQRENAAVAAKVMTEERLLKHYSVAATRLDEAGDREERLAARQEIEKYEMALAAKRAWDRADPYKKQYSFRPPEAGDNLDKLPRLLELYEINDVGCGGLSPKEVQEEYGLWKKKYDEFIRRHEEAPENEQQAKFFQFLESFNIEVGDVRKFYKLGTYERERRTFGTYKGDILLEPVGQEDFSFVEIKAIYEIDENIQEVLKEALYQAAMHVVMACMMHPMPIENTVEPPQATPPKKRSKSPENASQALPPKKKSKSPKNAPKATRHYKRRVAVIALPVLVSRFGVVEFDLDEKGNITNFTIAAGKNVIWKETDKSLKEKLEDIRNSSFTAAKKHTNEETATEIANDTVQDLIKKKRKEQQKLVEIGGFVLVPEKKAARDFVNYASRCLVGINPTETPVNE